MSAKEKSDFPIWYVSN